VRAGDGHVYERWAIEKWLAENDNRSPLTNSIIDARLVSPDMQHPAIPSTESETVSDQVSDLTTHKDSDRSDNVTPASHSVWQPASTVMGRLQKLFRAKNPPREPASAAATPETRPLNTKKAKDAEVDAEAAIVEAVDMSAKSGAGKQGMTLSVEVAFHQAMPLASDLFGELEAPTDAAQETAMGLQHRSSIGGRQEQILPGNRDSQGPGEAVVSATSLPPMSVLSGWHDASMPQVCRMTGPSVNYKCLESGCDLTVPSACRCQRHLGSESMLRLRKAPRWKGGSSGR